MAKIVTANTLLSKHVTRRDRVLLLNPPVEETRYNWVRWNQPLDLLKIGSRLKSQVECGVELIDCMKPDASGKVVEAMRALGRRHHALKGQKYPMRQYGMSYAELTRQLTTMQKEGGKRLPTQVWITSLCSYWFESVTRVCGIIRQSLPDAVIVLLGQYARLMTEHALEFCTADYVVSRPCDLSDEPAALELYRSQAPLFLALQPTPGTAVADAKAAVARGIQHLTFFDDDLYRDDGQALDEIVSKTKGLHKHLRYHFICGLDPAKVTPQVARVLADKQVAEVHFEESDAGDELDVEAYRKARAYLREAGMIELDNRLSGFVWIGRPGERLEEIVQRTFQVLDCLRGVILKPFTPTLGSPEQQAHREYLSQIPYQEWSPHFFPFAELNKITRQDYHDLYRMAAFLNEKVRDESFDFLKGTLGAQFLRESLRREVWKLEPSPLRIVD
jgi:hypothetical protein